jgi:hypothetical protein
LSQALRDVRLHLLLDGGQALRYCEQLGATTNTINVDIVQTLQHTQSSSTPHSDTGQVVPEHVLDGGDLGLVAAGASRECGGHTAVSGGEHDSLSVCFRN